LHVMQGHHHMLKYRHSVHGQWDGPSGLLVDLRLPHDRQSTVATRLQGLLPRAIRQGPRLLPEGYGREFVMATDEPELPGKTEGPYYTPAAGRMRWTMRDCLKVT